MRKQWFYAVTMSGLMMLGGHAVAQTTLLQDDFERYPAAETPAKVDGKVIWIRQGKDPEIKVIKEQDNQVLRISPQASEGSSTLMARVPDDTDPKPGRLALEIKVRVTEGPRPADKTEPQWLGFIQLIKDFNNDGQIQKDEYLVSARLYVDPREPDAIQVTYFYKDHAGKLVSKKLLKEKSDSLFHTLRFEIDESNRKAHIFWDMVQLPVTNAETLPVYDSQNSGSGPLYVRLGWYPGGGVGYVQDYDNVLVTRSPSE